jgi:hypothetical protein
VGFLNGSASGMRLENVRVVREESAQSDCVQLDESLGRKVTSLRKAIERFHSLWPNLCFTNT